MARGQLKEAVRQIRQLAAARDVDEQSDCDLLGRFVGARDEIAFAALMRRHGPLVLNVCCLVLHHEQDAEDAMQATFLVLARKAKTIRKAQSLASWLHGVAFRVAMKAKKQAAKRKSKLVPPPVTQSDPSAEASLRELQARLHEEVQHLPEKYRAPFVLCCLEGHSRAEAAQLLRWKDGTLSTRLAQARLILRKRLRRRGVALSAALTATGLSPGTISAAIPSALIQATTEKAAVFASGSAAGTMMSPAVALAESILHSMSLAKAKTILLATLTLGLLTVGVGLAAQTVHQAGKPKDLSAETQTTARPLPKVDKPTRTDRLGDLLPDGTVARLGTVRWRHGFLISSFVFSPDSKTLISGGEDSVIRIWDAGGGKELRRLTGHRDEVNSIALSRDGKALVSGGGDGTIRLWEVATGKEVRQIAGHQGAVLAVAISPDGKTVASGGSDKAIRLWNVIDGNPVHQLLGHKLEIASLAFSPDGKMLASASAPWERIVKSEDQDTTIRFWSVATGKEIGQLVGHKQGIRAIVFSPDGKMLASAGAYHALGDRAIRMWNVANRVEVRRWEPKDKNESFDALAFSSDGKTLAAGTAGTSALLQNPNLAAGLTEGEYKIRLWDIGTGKQLRELPAGAARCVEFSPDGKSVAFLSADRTIQIWDLATHRPMHHFDGHEAGVMSVVFSANGKTLVSGGQDKTVRVWDVTTSREVAQFRGHKQGIHCVAISPDSKTLASGSYDHTLRLWDTTAGKEIACEFQSQDVLGVGFSPDGKLLGSAGANGKILLLDVGAVRKPLHRLSVEVVLASLAWSPIGSTIATGGSDGKIVLWDGATGTKLREWKGHQGIVRGLAFSPDGNSLASASEDRQIILWEMCSGKERRRLQHPQMVSCVAFSPLGDFLVSGSESRQDATIHIWYLAKEKELVQLTGHQAGVNSLAFSPYGSILASGSNDTTILLWDVAALRKKKGRHDVRLSRKELDGLWNDLSSGDAGKAYSAIWTLVAGADETLPFLKERLRPIQPADPQRVSKLISFLDSEEFAAREKAAAELQELGESAAPAMRQSLEKQPTPEVHRRLQALLEQLKGPIQSASLFRALRAIEALEHIGTAEAKKLLDSLAQGIPESRQTQEARQASKRLSLR